MSLAALLGAAAPAAAMTTRDRDWFVTAYRGQWMSPRGLIGGDFDVQDAHFTSLAVSHVLLPELRLDLPLLGRLLDGGSLELEGQLGLHAGLQHHTEATLALAWRSPDLSLPGPMRLNLAVAEGVSYALARPAHEGAVNGLRRRKFLNYLAFEAEFTHAALPDLALVPRLHHRSGIFGVIAPQRSGSDFIGLGLRMTLR
ncbi:MULTISPECIES: hypothetical protein [Roseomonadaceae]|uniref:Cellulose biosynthesis protein BcsS n=1 Tax=Falsiroseomonas oleicola TaxID=2801474 RepID=A0ABS6HCC7_9PROT|nr:hypothetical protein [Roseomonas oleicola]MBU8546382.1 hypothetical protein [Roseomonas oleicola]